MKTTAKRIALTLLASVGYVLLLPLVRIVRQMRKGPEFRVLTYHSVGDLRRHETNVSSGAFTRQMAFLARHARVMNLEELVELAGSGRTIPANAVAVTLDDGYADNVTEAAPILREHGLTATCFVAASYVGTDDRLEHDRYEAWEGSRMMSWEEACAFVEAGMTIGSHGMRHLRFSRATDESLRSEIRSSAELIEQRIGRKVRLISYPYGRLTDYDQRATKEARAAGYDAGATARYGWNVPGCDMFELRRIGVESSDTVFTLRAKLNGALDCLVLLESRRARKLVGYMNRWMGA